MGTHRVALRHDPEEGEGLVAWPLDASSLAGQNVVGLASAAPGLTLVRLVPAAELEFRLRDRLTPERGGNDLDGLLSESV